MNIMKTINKIAQNELDIDTLETQGNDSLDFHDVSVACLKSALEAAYKAGQESSAGCSDQD